MSTEKSREVIGTTQQGEVCIIEKEHNVLRDDTTTAEGIESASRFTVRQGGRTITETADGDLARQVAQSLVDADDESEHVVHEGRESRLSTPPTPVTDAVGHGHTIPQHEQPVATSDADADAETDVNAGVVEDNGEDGKNGEDGSDDFDAANASDDELRAKIKEREGKPGVVALREELERREAKEGASA